MRRIKRAFRHIKATLLRLFLPAVSRMVRETRGANVQITFKTWFNQKVLGHNRSASWPMSKFSQVMSANRIEVGIGSAPGLAKGCYIQGNNGIFIGNYVLMAANVGIISANHNLYDHSKHDIVPPVRIDDYCWIGYGASVMPGVELGKHTIVAAGAVVTKSFKEGYCILAGVPAQVIKRLDKEKVVEYKDAIEYKGYKRVCV